MVINLEQLGSELSLFRADQLQANWNSTLHYCRTELVNYNTGYSPTKEDDLLHDVLLKSLLRGRRPFSSYFTEQQIVALYGTPYNIKQKAEESQGSISYLYDGELREAYQNFTDVIEPWYGHPSEVSFDPGNPKNERVLFVRLLDNFGSKLAHCTEPQADIAKILDKKTAGDSSGNGLIYC